MIQEQTISFDELVAALKEMNEKIGSLSYYIFAIKYGEVLKNHNLTEIIRSAGLTESMSKELSKGLRLYKVLTNNDFGIKLNEKDGNIITNEYQSSISHSEQKDSLQQIFYGTPGTGKSHTINEALSRLEGLHELPIKSKENIESLIEFRDNTIHFVNMKDLSKPLQELGFACIKNYVQVIKDWQTKHSLSKSIPHAIGIC